MGFQIELISKRELPDGTERVWLDIYHRDWKAWGLLFERRSYDQPWCLPAPQNGKFALPAESSLRFKPVDKQMTEIKCKAGLLINCYNYVNPEWANVTMKPVAVYNFR